MMEYTNKEGFSVQQVYDIISNKHSTKSEIIKVLESKKSIDTLLNKLLDSNKIEKIKNGRMIMYCVFKDMTVLKENPYQFVLGFFTSIDSIIQTQNFKRKDNHIVKAIYRKFTTLCTVVNDYNLEQQHKPFYRRFIIDTEELTVTVEHIDMDFTIKGIHHIFNIPAKDLKYVKELTDG